MNSTDITLAALFDLQVQMEGDAAKLLRDAQAIKTVLKRQPLDAALPELLAELRRTSDTLKTTATRCRSALVEHADAEHAKEMASRPKWKPSRHASPGQRARRDMFKRGCLAGDFGAPRFGL
ncbi:hypothetical protein IPC367_18975 [Pseudomonas aeruginosa]|uniref:hypothetical protein n=1 Tax=Pseudomonas aeruginosa group TaxID=136841 RepID=UPI00070F2F55|nr:MULTISPECIES: hypothetical protein [Pseudomonas aeruginosa group]EMB4117877.1 hypothetical protein [Pseudomonas aeruginosa]MDI3608137.1 hypothetical protein [Pseudomonas aeruginosa]MDI3674898.1 hypothetical protein [Pseudomonas aeruginosa]MDI3705440.1 hypothetical protein [Pseudomonas aeruginosa]MDI3759522.1 hypothetical protein [Pseudomonas aeruginosa]